MRGGVKQFLAAVGSQTHSDDSMLYNRSCVYDHPRTRKMVQKQNIIDNAPTTTPDVKATDLPVYPKNPREG